MLNKLYKLIDTDYQQGLIRKAFIFTAIVHLLAVIFSEGFHRPDEHLGIFRLMSFKLGNFPIEKLSWEHAAQIRPWLQPYAFYLVAKVTSFLGIENPFILSLILRLLCSLLGLYSLYKFTLYSLNFIKEKKNQNIAIILIATMWYLPFFHARTTAESLGLSFFLLGLVKIDRFNTSICSIISASLFFGVSYILRFQMGVMVFFALVWPLLNKKIHFKSFSLSTFFLLLTIGVSSLIDFIGYGNWTFTSWNYVYENIFNGVASQFGVSPWYYYIEKSFLKGIPPYSFFLVIPFFWMWIKRPKHYLTWITLPFFIIHCLIGHKELRFIFPLGVFAPVMLAIFLDQYKVEWRSSKFVKPLLIVAIILNFTALAISSLKPAYTPISFYKHLYNKKDQVSTLYTLSLIRDELDFYQEKKFEQVYIKENKVRFIAALKSDHLNKWVFTSNFKYILELNKIKRCKLDFSTYSTFLLNKKYSKIFKKSKIWTLYKCSNN